MCLWLVWLGLGVAAFQFKSFQLLATFVLMTWMWTACLKAYGDR